MIARTLTALLLVLALQGCVSQPTVAEIDSADYGAKPENHQAIIQAHLRRVMRDPDSTKVEFVGGPTRTYSSSPATKRQFGWGVCANINGKNAYGGYTGFTEYFFLIRNDRLIEMTGSSLPGPYNVEADRAKRACRLI